MPCFPNRKFSSSPVSNLHVPLLGAGVTMKLMDEVAGIVAARHCKTNIVTASVDAINFHDKIRKGNGTLLTTGSGVACGSWVPCTLCFWVLACITGVLASAHLSRETGSQSCCGIPQPRARRPDFLIQENQ